LKNKGTKNIRVTSVCLEGSHVTAGSRPIWMVLKQICVKAYRCDIYMQLLTMSKIQALEFFL